MLSAVLIALYSAAPGSPATTSQKTGATMPSEKFSARLSIAARAIPARSSRAVSRPTMCDTALRPASRSCRSSAEATLATYRCRLRCAMSALASTATGTMPNGRRSNCHCTANVTAPTTPSAIATAKIPTSRRRAGVISRLNKRSRPPIKAPIQVTGWPMTRTSRSG